MGKRITTKDFIQMSKNVSDQQYDYSKTTYFGKKYDVTIICNIHGSFRVLADNHLRRGTGCLYCKGNVPLIGVLTQEYLKKWFIYDPETGIITNKATGDTKGTHIRYTIISCGGNQIGAHRFAFLYMVGRIPEEVDHIDRDTSNNAWYNLRATTADLNKTNRAVAGAERQPNGKYRARMNFKGKAIHLGMFDTRQEALDKVQKKKKKSLKVMNKYHNDFIKGKDIV